MFTNRGFAEAPWQLHDGVTGNRHQRRVITGEFSPAKSYVRPVNIAVTRDASGFSSFTAVVCLVSLCTSNGSLAMIASNSYASGWR